MAPGPAAEETIALATEVEIVEVPTPTPTSSGGQAFVIDCRNPVGCDGVAYVIMPG